MKQITLVIKPFRAERVLAAIADLGIATCAVRDVKGYSRQKGYLERYVGSEYSLAFLPKVEITLWIDDREVEPVVDRLVGIARTGRIGDGKVFVVPSSLPMLEF